VVGNRRWINVFGVNFDTLDCEWILLNRCALATFVIQSVCFQMSCLRYSWSFNLEFTDFVKALICLEGLTAHVN
jgi:hypothetical protein